MFVSVDLETTGIKTSWYALFNIEIITIVESILAFQDSKELNLSREVFIQAKIQLASIIEEMAKKDEEGKYL